jgi:hypothetical protein
MKLSDAKKYLPLVQAASEEKTIQFKSKFGHETWLDCSDGYNLFADDYEYRVKPETKLRPWTAEEVPMLARYRRKGYPDEWMTLAGLSGYGKGVKLSLCTGWIQAFEDLEHSTDGGKTWLLCGVETTE